MTDLAIRYRRRGKNYRAPLLLKHSNVKWLMLMSLSCLLLIFFSGYLLGFYKSETKVITGSTLVPLQIPSLPPVTVAQLAPQMPQVIAPGEEIDVDLADLNSGDGAHSDGAHSDGARGDAAYGNSARSDSAAVSASAVKTSTINTAAVNSAALKATTVIPAEITPATPVASTKQISRQPLSEGILSAAATIEPVLNTNVEPWVNLPMGGPAASDPGQSDRLSVIHDDATEETAQYTLQIGTYGKVSNAERRIEALRAAELNSYMTEFVNKSDKVLYAVRLGYYSGYNIAQEALDMYESEMAGSGYVVLIKRR